MSEDQLYSYTCDVLDLLEGTGITEDNLDGNLINKCINLGMRQHAAAEYIKLHTELAREREITQGLQIQLDECDCENLRGELTRVEGLAVEHSRSYDRYCSAVFLCERCLRVCEREHSDIADVCDKCAELFRSVPNP